MVRKNFCREYFSTSYNLLRILIIFTFFLLLGGNIAVHSQGPERVDNPDEFNYSSMVYYVVSDQARNEYVGNPYENGAPVMGALIFGIILKYADSFFETDIPPGESHYSIHLLGPGQYREIRVYDGWIGYKNKIALMMDEDYRELVRLLESRLGDLNNVDDADVENYIEKVQRMPKESFVPEFESLKRARIKFKSVSPDYDTLYSPSRIKDDEVENAQADNEINTFEPQQNLKEMESAEEVNSGDGQIHKSDPSQTLRAESVSNTNPELPNLSGQMNRQQSRFMSGALKWIGLSVFVLVVCGLIIRYWKSRE